MLKPELHSASVVYIQPQNETMTYCTLTCYMSEFISLYRDCPAMFDNQAIAFVNGSQVENPRQFFALANVPDYKESIQADPQKDNASNILSENDKIKLLSEALGQQMIFTALEDYRHWFNEGAGEDRITLEEIDECISKIELALESLKCVSPDESFCLHVKEWDQLGVPYGRADLRKLAAKYGIHRERQAPLDLPAKDSRTLTDYYDSIRGKLLSVASARGAVYDIKQSLLTITDERGEEVVFDDIYGSEDYWGTIQAEGMTYDFNLHLIAELTGAYKLSLYYVHAQEYGVVEEDIWEEIKLTLV